MLKARDKELTDHLQKVIAASGGALNANQNGAPRSTQRLCNTSNTGTMLAHLAAA